MKEQILEFIDKRANIEGMELPTTEKGMRNVLKHIALNNKEALTRSLANNYYNHIKQFGI